MEILKNKKAVIFDLDGTIVDSLDVWNRVDVLLAQALGCKSPDAQVLHRLREQALERFKSDPQPYVRFCGEFGKFFGSKLSAEEVHALRYQISRKDLKIDYDPVVNIQKIKARKRKGKKTEKSELAAAKETAKYQVKSSDYITGDRKRDLLYIENLEQALANTRQFGYGGVLKDIRHDLKLDEKEDDLINVDDEKESEKEPEKVTYKWNFKFGNYVQISN